MIILSVIHVIVCIINSDIILCGLIIRCPHIRSWPVLRPTNICLIHLRGHDQVSGIFWMHVSIIQSLMNPHVALVSGLILVHDVGVLVPNILIMSLLLVHERLETREVKATSTCSFFIIRRPLVIGRSLLPFNHAGDESIIYLMLNLFIS